MESEADCIATTVLDTYNSLPAKYKPVKATDDFFQWVPLSGIVAIRKNDQKPKCLSLGTGMKCLPINQVAEANGSILHDWHAEIVAIRAFNHFLLHECLELAASPTTISHIVRRRAVHELSEAEGLQPFSIHDDIQLHMYSSEAPCGDASMELLMEAQVDATPWPINQLHPATKKSPGLLRGRESFSELGIVRRKPARADSPQTLSKSCSDKLALKQCTSLLSSRTSLLVNPANAYLETLILPRSQCVEHACERCFGSKGRMNPVANHQWYGGYAFRPFKIRATNHEFAFSRRSKPESSRELRTSNIAAVCNPQVQEALILGRLQGRQKFDPKGASAICSKRMWRMTLQVLATLGTPRLLQSISESSHVQEWKKSALFADRQWVKADVTAEALSGWIRNDGDDFEVEPG
ncbi:MAG: hypothetical protein L6R42_006689 [Xanthoria sp. 1 TBL-2021]|nr:MAG: hypothetical protein L6R42_006689 [Xanthoria sp. 1 TBL-2021]